MRNFLRASLALATLALVHGAAPAPAAATTDLNGIFMSDTDGGGWNTNSGSGGEFELFVIDGTNPNGTIVNGGFYQAFDSGALTPGTYDFTLIGNDNSGIEQQGQPRLDLSFSGDGTGPQISVHPGGTESFTDADGTFTLTSFTYSPWQDNGSFNRVNDSNASPDGYVDTIAHFELVVTPVPEPGTLALIGLGLTAGFSRARRRRSV